MTASSGALNERAKINGKVKIRVNIRYEHI